jgi:hypothetical protein
MSSDQQSDVVDPKLLEILVCPLTDPRWHSDHAAGGSAADRVNYQ